MKYGLQDRPSGSCVSLAMDDARKVLEASLKARLPVLDDLRVASPCKAEWSAMTGTDRVRHCGSCAKNVYNLSNLTRGEAEALIAASEGRPTCVRYYQRTDGTILLADCAVGAKRRRRRRILLAGAAVAFADSAITSAFVIAKRELKQVEHHEVMLGAVAMPMPVPTPTPTPTPLKPPPAPPRPHPAPTA